MDEAVRGAALAYARRHYPDADLVVVRGSAARIRRPRSDIDLLIVGPSRMFAAGADEAAHTDLWQGELFEVFASTAAAFQRHQVAGVARFRPVSGFLLLDGVIVLDRGSNDDLIAWNRDLITSGPAPSVTELDGRRYSVTNALDDLLDAIDPAEVAVLAGFVFERLAEFLLLANGRWIASGRHLLGRLMDLNPVYATSLGTALDHRDVPELERLTLEALEPFGGRLMAGYVR